MNKLKQTCFLSLVCWILISLSSCGGDETPADSSPDETKPADSSKIDSSNAEMPPPVEKVEVYVPKPEAPKPKPNPNGVYLPTGDERNGKPVYENQEGFSLWFNGSNWRITDRTGGGSLIASGEAELNGKWQDGGVARHFPDDEYLKDALFRLAVAFQGSEDNLNAIRLFEQFVVQFPEDKMIADVHLSLGDLAISEVKPDEQPNFDQITESTKNYRLVREKTQDISLISDATFNEGGLLERIAENPEGLVNHYYTFDKNKDEVLQEKEFDSSELFPEVDFAKYDLNEDKSLDFGELYDLASSLTFAQIEKLFRDYNTKFADVQGARVSQATAKIGFACEKQGRPSEMLRIYFEDIKKYGNDVANIGVDDILKKYSAKYSEYESLYGKTLDLLNKLQNPNQAVSFTYRNRKGIEENLAGTVEEILKDRRKLLPWLASSFEGMDSEIYSEVAKLRGAIFVNPDYTAKFKGYLKRYEQLQNNFPSDLSPANAFADLLQVAVSSSQKSLELRMRAILDEVGSSAGGSYNPQRSDFPAASAGVLVWMANKMIAQNSLDDAVAAMERLVEIYGDTGGEFLFDAHYLIGQAKEKERDYQSASVNYEAALTNSSWHENANDARMRLGDSLIKVGESTNEKEVFQKASGFFSEIRSDTDTSLDQRAEASFKMGECLRQVRDHAGAAFLYLETTLNFPSAVKWAPKSYEQAIRCYEQTGQTDQIARIEKQYGDWQRKFLK
ncbi:MAG: tetratricopeptide repeat protein [Verrucomicrobiota bacterium]|nr:tetratricopeptide repeat protein [Verrucomicrobiota bacterium]MEC8043856.1 tetratricopeptide repeat protein [Verrucomicrobiota bacterium]